MSVFDKQRQPVTRYRSPDRPRYRPDGIDARDSWIYELRPESNVPHVATAEQRYWQGKLSQPEFRGKCKQAVASNVTRNRNPEGKHPLVPAVATTKVMQLPPMKMTVRSSRVAAQAEAETRAFCDALAVELGVPPRRPLPPSPRAPSDPAATMA